MRRIVPHAPGIKTQAIEQLVTMLSSLPRKQDGTLPLPWSFGPAVIRPYEEKLTFYVREVTDKGRSLVEIKAKRQDGSNILEAPYEPDPNAEDNNRSHE